VGATGSAPRLLIERMRNVKRSSDMVKILWWDRTGLVVLSKRLEGSRFKFLDRALTAGQSFELTAGELMLILEGFDLEGAKRRIKNHAVS
jgi:hypothetical protein